MSILTWARRSLLAAATALLVVALVAPAGVDAREDPDAGRPPVFRAGAFTTAVQVALNTDPQTFVAELVRMDLPHGSAEFAQGNSSTARAASLYPGVGFTQGPFLAWNQACTNGFPCEEFPGIPPEYPLMATAQYPTRPDAEARFRPPFEQDSHALRASFGEPDGPLSGRAHDVRAHAGRDHVSTTAVVGDLRFLPVAGAPGTAAGGSARGGLDEPGHTSEPAADRAPVLLAADELVSRTRLEFDGDVLVSRAESLLTGVSLFGGAVEIEEIHATATSRSDGDGALEGDPHVTVSGVTVGGTPAAVTEEGLVVADRPCVVELPAAGRVCATDQGLLNSLGAGAEQLFGAAGTDVRLVRTSQDTSGGTRSEAGASALLVDFTVDASGFPSGTAVEGSLALGIAGASSFVGTTAPGSLSIDTGGFEGTGGTGGTHGTGGTSETATVAGATATSDDPAAGGGFPGDVFAPGATGGSAGDAATGAPPLAGPSHTGPASTRPAAFPLEALDAVAANRVEALYAAWALAVVGLALGSRARPLRLGSSR